MSPIFRDRRHAGRLLAAHLGRLGIEDPMVVAMPRGGVPVAFEVATALNAPLDITLVRKLGAPGREELGVGALDEDGTVILDSDTISALGVTRGQIEAIARHEAMELERRRRLYRQGLDPLDVNGRTVVLVDDGLATGVTAVATVRVLRDRGARRIILAVPVCPEGTAERLGNQIGELVALHQPAAFGGVGAWYEDFSQTTDEEVLTLLRAARAVEGAPGPVTDPMGRSLLASIGTRDGAELDADVGVPAEPTSAPQPVPRQPSGPPRSLTMRSRP